MASASKEVTDQPPSRGASLLSIFEGAIARRDILDSDPAKLLVTVDTEEAFDWSKPYSRSETNVEHVKHQGLAQRIFERFGVKPIYIIDYPVATQESGYRLLREWQQDGRCEIGAHLHPWVNPPFEEEISARNSYPGNLAPGLERAKLARLVDQIEQNFGKRPQFYRAGRYGIGPSTGAILEELGFKFDSSVVPRTDFSHDHGPDFADFDTSPFWFGPQRRVLEIPLTAGWCGLLRDRGPQLWPVVHGAWAMRLHVPGIFARSGLLERIRLTPEGNSFAELKRLTDVLFRAGVRLFNFTYHSPSLESGNTPYVRNSGELRRFLGIIESYCDYFFGAFGGTACSLNAIWHSATPADFRLSAFDKQRN